MRMRRRQHEVLPDAHENAEGHPEQADGYADAKQ
jgi:hypothetical protein